jgi:hypothetical protein
LFSTFFLTKKVEQPACLPAGKVKAKANAQLLEGRKSR